MWYGREHFACRLQSHIPSFTYQSHIHAMGKRRKGVVKASACRGDHDHLPKDSHSLAQGTIMARAQGTSELMAGWENVPGHSKGH